MPTKMPICTATMTKAGQSRSTGRRRTGFAGAGRCGAATAPADDRAVQSTVLAVCGTVIAIDLGGVLDRRDSLAVQQIEAALLQGHELRRGRRDAQPWARQRDRHRLNDP